MIDNYLFWILLIIIIIYTLKKTRLLNIFSRPNKNIEGFRGEFSISSDLAKDMPCLEEEEYDDTYLPRDIILKDINYISKIVDENTKEYILLTNPELYLNNLKYISNYNPYVEFIPQNMDYESIIEQLQFNVYTYNNNKHTDIISIVPEYYLEKLPRLKDNLNKDISNTHEKKKPSIMEKDILDYIRYIGGVSYTYYFFMVPFGAPHQVIASLNDLPLNIYILYDYYMISKSKKYIEINKSEIELDLSKKYKDDNQLNFIKDFIKFITRKTIRFIPMYIDDFNEDENAVILGNNNMSHNILGHFGINESGINIYDIIGFDENLETVNIEDKNVQDIDNHYGNCHFNLEEELTDYIDKKTYIERQTKILLNKNKLHNTLIKNVNAFNIHQIPIKCKYSNNIDNNKRLEDLHKAGYDEICIPYKLDKYIPWVDMFPPIKTFLFRNVAITHKFTNKKFVYNLLNLFMKKIQLNNEGDTLNNKLNLMSLKTNIELHKGADKFYRDNGFIVDIPK